MHRSAGEPPRKIPFPAISRICAFFFLIFAIACIGCASKPRAAKLSSASSYVILPPELWPGECPIVFLDSAGKPLQGAVSKASVRVSLFGYPGTLKAVSIEEDGSVAAASLSLDPVGGSALSLPALRLRPSPLDPGAASVEWTSPDGWSFIVETWKAAKGGLACSGALRSDPPEARPGSTANSSASFADCLLSGKSKSEWSNAVLSDIRVSLDMESGQDSLFSAAATPETDKQGRLTLRCGLSLQGGSELGLGQGPGSLLFPDVSISGSGAILLPEPAQGSARFRLSDGFGLELTSPRFESGRLSGEGRFFLPPEWGTELPLDILPGKLLAGGLRSLAFDLEAQAPDFSFLYGGMRVRAPGLSFSHRAKSLVAIPEPTLEPGIPLGSLGIEEGRLKAGSRSFPSGQSVEGYGGSLSLSSVSWGPEGFGCEGSARLSGVFSGSPLSMPAMRFGPGGVLVQADPEASFEYYFSGRQYAARGFSLSPDGLASFGSLSPVSSGRRQLVLERFSLGPSGAIEPGSQARVTRFAGESDFIADSLSPIDSGAVRLSGHVELRFAGEGHSFSGRLESDDIFAYPDGELGVGECRLREQSVQAFLGLLFKSASFSLKKGRAILTLSGGSFAKGGVWPSGGAVNGLGLDLDSMKYDVSGLVFEKPAIFRRAGSVFELSAFSAALDDAYVLSGSVRLAAAPGAPWAAGDQARVDILRLDGFGNVRELKLILDGKRVDALPWFSEGYLKGSDTM